jgi:hypothetical protein
VVLQHKQYKQYIQYIQYIPTSDPQIVRQQSVAERSRA